MNKTLLPFILAGIVMCGAVAPAVRAQKAPDTTAYPDDTIVKLPEFSISADSVDPYNAAEASSAARTATAMMDLPLTAYVITPAMIKDLNPIRLFDLTSYYPGVSAGRAQDINDRSTFRGFENYGSAVDNFSNVMIPYMYGTWASFPTVFLDHAELIMGPDAILSPTGTPGGTNSAITKSPLFTPYGSMTVTEGNWDGNKYTFDFTGPLGDGKHLAYRVMAEYQNAHNFGQGTIAVEAAGAELTYKFSDTAKLMVKYFAYSQRLGGTLANQGADGEMVYTPDTVGGVTISTTPQPGFSYSGWNGDATWSSTLDRDNVAEAELTAAVFPHVNMRLAGQAQFTNINSPRAYPIPPLTETWDPHTGQETAVAPFNLNAVPELGYEHNWMNREIQFQNDFAGDFNVGSVTLKPIAGWAYNSGIFPFFYTVETKNMPAADLSQPYYSPPIPAQSAFNIASTNEPMSGWTMQAYGYIRAGFFHDRVFLTGGASRTWAGAVYYLKPFINQDGYTAGNLSAPVVTQTFSNTGNPLAPSVKPWHDAYVAGVVAKLLPNVSAYANFSTDAALASASPLWQAGKQYEFGVKSSFFNKRLSISADHFQIRQSNVSFQNPLVNLGLSTVLSIYQSLENHGEEVSVQGGLTTDLSAIVSYTNQALRDPWGRRQRNIPDSMANMLLDYHFHRGFLKDLDIFAGVQHQGNVAVETVTGFTPLGVPELPGAYLPSFTLVNAGAGYTWGRYGLHLNINNVLDTRAWWQAQSRSSVVPVNGTTVLLTGTVQLY